MITDPKTLYPMYATRLKELRKLNRLTQDQVADMLGCKRSKISTYETGARNMTVEALIFFAQIYHTSADYILGLTNDRDFIERNCSDEDFANLLRVLNKNLSKE